MTADGELCLKEARWRTGSTWVLVTTITAWIMCLVSLILAAAALGKPNQATVLVTPIQTALQQQDVAKKIWLFAVGHDYGAHEYFDNDGYLQGFSPDIVKGVCKAGGLDCRLVVDRYTNCWKSNIGDRPSGGMGLMDSWYDACVGWFKTLDRAHVFEFTQPYAKTPDVYFFTKVGSTFNGENLTGKKIGFVNGWASDEKCLSRQEHVKNNTLPDENVLKASSPKELIEWINNGKVDAGFASWYTFGGDVQNGKLNFVNRQSFHCFLHGNSIMTRKGSKLIPIWNEAFHKFKSNQDFHKLCEEANEKHGNEGSITCVD